MSQAAYTCFLKSKKSRARFVNQLRYLRRSLTGARFARRSSTTGRRRAADRVEICVTVEHVARTIGAPRHQRRRRANSTNGRSTTATRALGTGRGTRTEERGHLTVCRLNVLGPLLNQLTYCLCGRQPLPCLHGTFLLSFPSSLSP